MKTLVLLTLFAYAFTLMGCGDIGAGMEGHHEGEAGHHHKMHGGEESELSGVLHDGIRVIEVKAFQYGFEPDPIVVRLGEKVRLEAISSDVAHGIGIEDFGVNLVVPAEKKETVEFIAAKAGTFHVHCSVYCGPGHGKMHGSLIVIE